MSQLTGTRHLAGLILRRDRVRLPVWVLGTTALTAVSAHAVQDLYDTPVKVAGYRRTVEDSAVSKLLNGTAYGVDTLGGIVSYEVTATSGVIVALMVVFLVVRHTRGEEESGTAELLRGTVTGRHAATAAALLVATGACLLVGLLDAAVLRTAGLPAGGSLLHGAALVGVGLTFTAVAAASAQITASARGALGLAGAVLAVLFVVRGVGAVRDDALVWASPFGWQQEVREYGDQRWWPLLLLVLLAAAVFAGAAQLTSHRDFGAGLVAARGGRPRAGVRLATAWGLALRTQRGLLLGWTVGLVLAACLFGAVGREVITVAESNPEILEVFGGRLDDIVRSYFSFVIPFLCVIASAYGLTSVLRLRHEEDAGRAELVLSAGMDRTRWALGALAVTVLGSLGLLLLMGLGAGGTHALVSGETELFWPLVATALAQAPAVLLLAALGVLLVGWAPHRTLLAWALFAFALVQAYLGELLAMPDWLAGLSPFWHLPLLPVEDFRVLPAAVLTALALACAGLGLVGLRRRDLT
ncbi:hypothetical protein [Nocardioides sp. 616]|uniref:ABC transporter permease n=1 Tax=Nocardioides sp. 616 TaxID=2268090 RepID=UPI000CE2E686|nr:hypothetical protein [Nocardioides sp. 616]